MNNQKASDYDDIINLPHHVSKRYPRMSLMNRAAQFSPFAALTGHEAAIRETARMTDSFVELDEDQKEQLDEQLKLIRQNLEKKPECEIICFQPDEKKSGGTYVMIRRRIKRIDETGHQIIFTDDTALPIKYLFAVSSISLSPDSGSSFI